MLSDRPSHHDVRREPQLRRVGLGALLEEGQELLMAVARPAPLPMAISSAANRLLIPLRL